ncbi:MAG TPA: glycosyltransferase [Actinospica sp.]|nr:glycosyltransferase [Actinospica sp.]
MPVPEAARTTVVIATRNRSEELCGTLERLFSLPEQPDVIVVDNASTDATPREVGSRFPAARLVSLPDNRGAAARTVGARLARTPWIAFSDDDSWWSAGSLERAAACLSRSPRLGLVAARPVIEPDGISDPVVRRMADSPLPRAPRAPGPAVLGFLACAAVVRRTAYLGVGGFHPLLFLGGEERLLAYDLVAAGWELAYREDVVAHHQPSPQRDPLARRALDLRNQALIGWLRRPVRRALGLTADLARRATEERAARRALLSLGAMLPHALRERSPLPAEVEARVRLLERFEDAEAADGRA